MQNQIFVAESEADLKRCYPVLKELRPQLSLEDYLSIYHKAHASDGYEIAAIETRGNIMAVIGYRFLWDFVRGKHVYVDDLVSTGSARSQGLGAQLLKYAETIAEANECKSLRLCAAIDNLGGIRFYERNGWTPRAFAFVKKVTGK